MKLAKLNARGFAHHFLLAAIVVGVAIGGTYYLVFSHADTATGEIAYVQQASPYGIYVMNADGSNKHALILGSNFKSGGTTISDLKWNHSGSKLAFSAAGDIFTINSNGLGLAQLTSNQNDYSPSWSGDDSEILFDRFTPGFTNSAGEATVHGELYEVSSSDGSNLQPILTNADALSPQFSPDGSKILYYANNDDGVGGHTNGDGTDYWVITAADGSNPTNLPVSFQSTGTWSPDSSKLAFAENSTAATGTNDTNSCAINTYSITSQQQNVIYRYDNNDCLQSISYSPDGQSLTFGMSPWQPTGSNGGGTSSNYTGSNVYTIATDGSNLDNLSTSTGTYPAWGPTPPVTYTASCTINDVPSTLASGNTMSPTITVTNTGTAAITPSVIAGVNPVGATSSNSSATKDVVMSQIAPGASATVALASYKATQTAETSMALTAASDMKASGAQASFYCTRPFAVTVTTVATCTVSDIPSTVKKGTQYVPQAAVKNTGTGTFNVNLNGYVTYSRGANTTFNSITYSNFTPGSSQTRVYSSGFTVPKSSTAITGTMHVVDSDAKTGFQCIKSFNISN